MFLYTRNSARSQMTDRFLRAFYNDKNEAFSAGIEKTCVNPYTFEVMKEIGIDLSKYYSKILMNFKI